MIVKTLIQLAFILINCAIAAYQAHRFDVKQKRIKHWIWSIYYAAMVAVTWPIHRNVYLIAAILTLHLPLFNTVLNYMRIPRKPFFYTHPEDPHGSLVDKLWGQAYPAVFFASSIFYIVINFYLYGSA